MSFRIATWNVNSIRIRTHLLARLAEEAAPDVVCLQEIKTEDAHFPVEEMRKLGFAHLAVSGQKGYHGVAVVSRVPLRDVETHDFLGNGDKRHIGVTLPGSVRLHNFYVPAGGDVPDPEANPKFADKLAFMDAFIAWSQKQRSRGPCIIAGDLNIAPLPHDVWSHRQLLGVVSHTPVEVARMEKLRESNDWVDSARVFTPPEEKLYSWWSYRNRDWRKSDRGRRLDHLWVSRSLRPALKSCITLRDARDWPNPSDHAPVIMEMER